MLLSRRIVQSKVIFHPVAILTDSFSSKRKSRHYDPYNGKGQPVDPKTENMPIEEIVKGLDLTITPEQRINVDKIKHKMRGGFLSPRCNYYSFYVLNGVWLIDVFVM